MPRVSEARARKKAAAAAVASRKRPAQALVELALLLPVLLIMLLGMIDLGRGLCATTILVRTGYGSKVEVEQQGQADYVVDDLVAAAQVIERIRGSYS